MKKYKLMFTLESAKAAYACQRGIDDFIKYLKNNNIKYTDKTKFNLKTLVKLNIEDAIWAFRCLLNPDIDFFIKFSKDCADAANAATVNVINAAANVVNAANAAYTAASYAYATTAYAYTTAAAAYAHAAAAAAYAADAAADAAAYAAADAADADYTADAADAYAAAATYAPAYAAAYAAAYNEERNRQRRYLLARLED